MSIEKTENFDKLKVTLSNIKLWVIVRGLSKKAVKKLLIHWVGTFTEEMQKKLINEIYSQNKGGNVSSFTAVEINKAFDAIEQKAIDDLNSKPAKVIISEIKEFLKKD